MIIIIVQVFWNKVIKRNSYLFVPGNILKIYQHKFTKVFLIIIDKTTEIIYYFMKINFCSFEVPMREHILKETYVQISLSAFR